MILQKLKDNKTNEDRKNIFCKDYVNFRANKLKVVMIFNIYDLSVSRQRIISEYKDELCTKETVYQICGIVEPDCYCEDIDQVFSNGIHYFRTIEAAYHYGIRLIILLVYGVTTMKHNINGVIVHI